MLVDLVRMPDFNPETQNDRGDWGLRNITDGTVLGWALKPSCSEHGAMNLVNPAGTIWRCLMCGRGCYDDGLPLPMPPRWAKESEAEHVRRAHQWRRWAREERPDLWYVSEQEVHQWTHWLVSIRG
jgi:hypothetical protein